MPFIMNHIKLRHIVASGHLHGMSAPDLNLDIALEPDALGRVLFRSQQAQGQTRPTIAYNYDAAGRLIGSQHGHDAHRYPVDAAGNRSSAPNATNQLTQLNGTRYRYDGAGNLVNREHPSGERLTLGYDGANRLVTLTRTTQRGTTTHAHYRYDALGRRIDKTVHHPDGTTATTHYGWDGDRIVREETSQQRSTVIYEPGSFVPMLRIDETQDPQGNQNTQLSTYLTDALGTPLQLLSPSGQPRWLAEPDDWAAVTKQRAIRGLTQPIRFQGQWHDDESGLYYNRHRYYDPEQGRYISQDPIGLNGGTNLYGYVTNPIGMVDPLGLEGTCPNVVPGRHGSLECVDESICIGQGMAKIGGNCQVRENAARARGGLTPSTATHDDSPSGIHGCAAISTALGAGDLPAPVEKVESIFDLTDKVQTIFDREYIPKPLSKLMTIPNRYVDNLKNCTETAGKQSFEIDSWD